MQRLPKKDKPRRKPSKDETVNSAAEEEVFLKLAEALFSDWNSTEDTKAFRDL